MKLYDDGRKDSLYHFILMGWKEGNDDALFRPTISYVLSVWHTDVICYGGFARLFLIDYLG